MSTLVAITATSRRTAGPRDSRHEQLHCPTAEVLAQHPSSITVRAPNGEVRTFDHSDWDIDVVPARTA